MAVRREKDAPRATPLTTLESLIAGEEILPYPFTFATACCGIEVMGAFGTHYDLSASAPRSSVSLRARGRAAGGGTINYKMAPC